MKPIELSVRIVSIELDAPDHLDAGIRAAIAASVDRLHRAVEADDDEQVIGAAKDTLECVAKSVLDTLNHSFAANEDLSALGAAAVDALGCHPSTFQGRQPIQMVAQALVRIPAAVALIRNQDGTGHGRPTQSDLLAHNAAFVADAAVTWCRWALASLGALLANADVVRVAIGRIGTDRFRTGELRALLEEIDVNHLAPQQQLGVGVAVGRRAAAGTFNVDTDILEPLVDGSAPLAAPVVDGIVEGSFIDERGFLRTTPIAATRVVQIAQGGTYDVLTALRLVADRANATDLAYAFSAEDRARVIAILRLQSSDATAAALISIADRIQSLSEAAL